MSALATSCWPAVRVSVLIAVGCLSGLIGCSRGRHHPVVAPEPVAGTVFADGSAQTTSVEGLVAKFAVAIDASRTSAEATPLPLRSGVKQGDIFDLDIADFQNRTSFRIIGLERTEEGYLELQFSHAHPFAAPDFSLPTSGMNRSDLGYTGRLLILTDNSPQSFFDDTVQLDAATVVEPDGYLDAIEMLDAADGWVCSAFPFVLLADEAKDNRVGVSNGGSMSGNYDPANAGWHRGNIGTTRDGWTGYDFVFQGQTITNSFVIDPAALPDGDFTITVALVVRYTDPRNGATILEKRANAMVPPVADYRKFAMRAPHAALETSVCAVNLEGIEPQVLDQPETCAPVPFTLRDWDTLATESSDDDLSDEPNVDYVVPGAGDVPGFELDAPDLSSRSSGAILVSYDVGVPGAELEFQALLHNESGTAAPGSYLGCLRITDAESGSDADYHYGIDPVTFLPTAVPMRDVYYPVRYEVIPLPASTTEKPVVLSGPCDLSGGIGETGILKATASNTPLTVTWLMGGGFTPNLASGNPLIGVFDGTMGIYLGSVTAMNTYGVSDPYYFHYNVGMPDLSAGEPVDTVVVEPENGGLVPAGNALIVNVTERGDPGIGTATIRFDWNQDGDYDDLEEGPQDITGTPPLKFVSPIVYANSGTSKLLETLGYTYTYSEVGIPRLDTLDFTVMRATQGAVLHLGDPLGRFDDIGGHSQSVTNLVLDPLTSQVYLVACWGGSHTTDPILSGTESGVLIAYKLTFISGAGLDEPTFPNLEYLWHDYLHESDPGGDYSEISDIAFDSSRGGPVIVGRADAMSDFGGTDTASSGAIVAAYTASGTLEFVSVLPASSGATALDDVVVGSDGRIYAGGFLESGTVDLDPGPGTTSLSGSQDMFVASYSSAGTLLWGGLIGGTTQVASSDVGLDEINDRVVYGGHTYLSGSVDLDPGAGVQSRSNAGYDDGFLVGLGTDGAYEFGYYFGGGLYDRVTSLAIDPSNGDIRFGMNASGVDIDPGGGIVKMTAGGVAALSASGTYQWHSELGVDVAPSHLLIDPDDKSIRASGAYNGTADFDPGTGVISVVSLNQDAFYWRLSRFGTYQSHAVWGGSGPDMAEALGMTTNTKRLLTAGTFKSTSCCFGFGRTAPCLDFKSSMGWSDVYLKVLSEDGVYRY